MIALMLISITSLWTADNEAFLTNTSPGDWEYVGYTERQPGEQADGAYALTAKSQGKTFILFKQRPKLREVADRDISE